jgi:hypothetical protein
MAVMVVMELMVYKMVPALGCMTVAMVEAAVPVDAF